MGILPFIAQRLTLARKRRQLKATREFCGVLEDQILSGEHSLAYHAELARQLESEIALLCPPDEILHKGVSA